MKKQSKQRHSGHDKAHVSEVTWVFLRFLKNEVDSGQELLLSTNKRREKNTE